MDSWTLPCIDVEDGETAKCSFCGSSITDKSKGQLVVDPGRDRQGSPHGNGEFFLSFSPQRKTFSFVQSLRSFIMIHYKALFLEKDVKRSYLRTVVSCGQALSSG